MMPLNQSKQVCKTCGGSGEIGYFQGESRFFITREECPACCGLGYALEEESGKHTLGEETKKDEEL